MTIAKYRTLVVTCTILTELSDDGYAVRVGLMLETRDGGTGQPTHIAAGGPAMVREAAERMAAEASELEATGIPTPGDIAGAIRKAFGL